MLPAGYLSRDAYYRDQSKSTDLYQQDPEAAATLTQQFVRAYERGNYPLTEGLYLILWPSMRCLGRDRTALDRRRHAMGNTALRLSRGVKALVRSDAKKESA